MKFQIKGKKFFVLLESFKNFLPVVFIFILDWKMFLIKRMV